MIVRDAPAWAATLEIGLDVGDLNLEEKKVLWDHLKNSHPEYASELKSLLSSQPFLSLIANFAAAPVVEEVYVPKSLRWKLSRY